MKKVITYGTFDLFHQGHYNILKRAKELGDYLIVGVTSENYDKTRGKLNVKQSLVERIENVKKTGLADKIIVEEYLGQKVDDVKKYDVDTFVLGSDWAGKCDYLKEYCNVVYLERTKGVSSTELRNKQSGILEIGVLGAGRIADRFVKEAMFVSGVNTDNVCGRDKKKVDDFVEKHCLKNGFTDYEEFLKNVDAVYIATPHLTHYDYAKKALENKKHVLCEKPLTLEKGQSEELYKIAKENNVCLFEAIKTVYSPGFNRLVALAKSGVIGKIKDVDATFTKLVEDRKLREFDTEQAGGSVTELSTYPLIAIMKLLGIDYNNINFYTYMNDDNIDLYTKIVLQYKDAIATAQVGLGVKKEGEMVISGTNGYILVPAPWWKTEYFEVRYEDQNRNERYFYKFEGDGLRYEIAEFLNTIHGNHKNCYLTQKESVAISEIIEKFRKKENMFLI